MIEINLLPHDFRKKINYKRRLQQISAYLLLLLIILLSLNIILSAVLLRYSSELKKLEKDWQRKSPLHRKIELIKKELNNLKNKEAVLKKYTHTPIYFSKVMYYLYKNLPLNVWFISLDFEVNLLQIKGAALDYKEDGAESIKRYRDALFKSPLKNIFPSLVLQGPERKLIKDKGVVYFELRLTNEKAKDR